MTWQLANSLSLMAIGLLLDLFSSDFAIVSTPSEQSIAIDCKRHPTNYTINRLPLFAIDCPGFTPWARVCRVFDAGNQSYIIYNSQQHTNKYLQYINFVYCYHLFPNDQM